MTRPLFAVSLGLEVQEFCGARRLWATPRRAASKRGTLGPEVSERRRGVTAPFAGRRIAPSQVCGRCPAPVDDQRALVLSGELGAPFGEFLAGAGPRDDVPRLLAVRARSPRQLQAANAGHEAGAAFGALGIGPDAAPVVPEGPGGQEGAVIAAVGRPRQSPARPDQRAKRNATFRARGIMAASANSGKTSWT